MHMFKRESENGTVLLNTPHSFLYERSYKNFSLTCIGSTGYRLQATGYTTEEYVFGWISCRRISLIAKCAERLDREVHYLLHVLYSTPYSIYVHKQKKNGHFYVTSRVPGQVGVVFSVVFDKFRLRSWHSPVLFKIWKFLLCAKNV
jgi:hypothetical protein